MTTDRSVSRATWVRVVFPALLLFLPTQIGDEPADGIILPADFTIGLNFAPFRSYALIESTRWEQQPSSPW